MPKSEFVKENIKLDVWTRNLLDADYTAFYFRIIWESIYAKENRSQVGAEVSVAFGNRNKIIRADIGIYRPEL